MAISGRNTWKLTVTEYDQMSTEQIFFGPNNLTRESMGVDIWISLLHVRRDDGRPMKDREASEAIR